MHRLYPMLVIVLEVCGTIRMKLFNAFSRFTPSILMFVFYGLSIAAFVFALKRIDVSTAYIIWAGLGVLLISVIGIAYFEQCISALKIV